MKRQEYLTAIVCTLGLFCMSGCMSIKDTSGIRKYLEDQGKAEMLAIEIKEITPDTSPDYHTAAGLYNTAAGTGNGWTSDILFDARVKREVNVSLDDYANSEAGMTLMAFLDYANETKTKFGGLRFVDPVTIAAIAPFVIDIIGKIEELNNQRVERVVKLIEQEFSRARWTSFENTTQQWIDKKYESIGND